jgi:hypothetical protein
MGKVATTNSVAEAAGPVLGGTLVQLITAPFVLALDAGSYLIGALSLAGVRRPEPKHAPAVPEPAHIFTELIDGLRFTFGEPHIRATALSAATSNFFAIVTETAFLLYAVRDLDFSPSVIGLVLAGVGLGGLVGAACSNGISSRWPIGRVYLGSRVIGGGAAMLLPLAGGSLPVAAAMCMVSFFLAQAALANTNVLNASLRQALTPDRLRGRMNASARTLIYGVLPVGGLAAGYLGTSLGLHATIWVGAIGYAASILPILASPIPRLVTLPFIRNELPG